MALRLLLAWLLALCAIPALAADINGFRVWTDPQKTRAVLDLDARAEYQVFTLDNPPRVVIDLQQSGLNGALQLVDEYAGVIEGVRHGRPRDDTLRVVLDLEDESAIKSFMLDPTGRYGHRLVIDLFPKNRDAAPQVVRQIADLQAPNRDVVWPSMPGTAARTPAR